MTLVRLPPSLSPTVERSFEQTRLACQLVIAAYQLVDPLIRRTLPGVRSAGARGARPTHPRHAPGGLCG